jgi:hypothetical protein
MKRQCCNVWATRTGARFCVREEGHGGDCRAYGVQWDPKTGKRKKPPTLDVEKVKRA